MKPYLKSIFVYNCYKSKNLLIDFPPENGNEFKHLIITGMNGSGKSTILKIINKILTDLPNKGQISQKYFDFTKSGKSETEVQDFLSKISIDYQACELDFISEYQSIIGNINFFHIYFPAKRIYSDTKLNTNSEFNIFETINNLENQKVIQRFIPHFINFHFEQFLLKLKEEQAFAIADNETAVAGGLTARFQNLEKAFQLLFEEPELKLKHVFRERKFYFQLPDGRSLDFSRLSDGHTAVLNMLAEIMLHIEALREKNPKNVNPQGIVVIDEIESHLHLSLQAKILPVLTEMFPTLQFIVATHSPVVIASIENATVYDLSSKSTVNENLTGIPYNVLMKSHFGIESEYSLNATEKLKRAKKLLSKMPLNDDENTELEKLTKELNELSPDLSLDIYVELERRKRNG